MDPQISTILVEFLGMVKTFNTILENIKNSYDLLEIVIRVNVDRTNISRVHEILDILEEEGLRNKLGFYIAQ